MKNKFYLIAGAALVVTLFVGIAATTVGVNPSPSPVTSSTSTNAVQNWPSALGSNAVIDNLDVTNVTQISPLGKDFSLEVVASFAGGTGGSCNGSNLVVRLADDNKTTHTSPLTTTNGTSANTFPILWSLTIPVTIASGAGSVDVITNLSNLVSASGAPSTTAANWYIYDVQWANVTNGSPFATNLTINPFVQK